MQLLRLCGIRGRLRAACVWRVHAITIAIITILLAIAFATTLASAIVAIAIATTHDCFYDRWYNIVMQITMFMVVHVSSAQTIVVVLV
eukprot:14161079-Alexandrium_andersonii.AAC.1